MALGPTTKGAAFRSPGDPFTCGDTACNGSKNVLTNCLRQWRQDIDLSCGHCYVPVPIVQASPNVYVNCHEFCRVGDPHPGHCCPGAGCHGGNAAKGSPNVFANVNESRDDVRLAPDPIQPASPQAVLQVNQAILEALAGGPRLSGTTPTPVDEEEQIKLNYIGTPDNPVEPPPSDIRPEVVGKESCGPTGVLTQLLQQGRQGLWDESGVGNPRTPQGEASLIRTSNPTIVRNCYTDMGMTWFKHDQIPWCMAFLNYVLKISGKRYVRTARAFDLRDNPGRWNATEITNPVDALCGDMVVWNYSHVNFIYTHTNPGPSGKFTFLGGNQRDRAGVPPNNDPSNGAVTLSWPNGYNYNTQSEIVGIYRPSSV